MADVNAQKGSMKAVGLVRNKYGQPQFDDFNDVAEAFHAHLTEEDWIYINSKRTDPCQ
jgi:hypothetical protein